ncbi:MAG: DUF1266 domain-containing protein [Spirochaetales bacterium]|nr:DUF1266 domain-containing protein [Spirochaetales bacterium]
MKYIFSFLFLFTLFLSCSTASFHDAHLNQQTTAQVTETNLPFYIHLKNGASDVNGLTIDLLKHDGSDYVLDISSVSDSNGMVYYDLSALEIGAKYFISIGKNDQGFYAGKSIGFTFSDYYANKGYTIFLAKKLDIKYPDNRYLVPLDQTTFKWKALEGVDYYSIKIYWAFEKSNPINYAIGYAGTTVNIPKSISKDLFKIPNLEKKIYFDEPVFVSEKIFVNEYTIPLMLQSNGLYYFAIDAYDSGDNLVASNGYSSMNTSRHYLFYRNPKTDEITLDREKYWAIALSGILNESNSGRHDTLEPHAFCRNVKITSLNILKDGWSTTSREEFFDTIARVREGGHSESYNEILELMKSHPESSIPDLAYDNGYSYYSVKKFYLAAHTEAITQGRSLRAWDLARCINVTRWAYQVNFITEDEAWEIILPVAKEIQQLYTSWREFAINYVAGRMFWAASSLTENEKRDEAIEAYYRILAQTDLPWRKGWDGNDEIVDDTELYINDELDFIKPDEEKAFDLFLSGLQNYVNKKIIEAMVAFEKSIELYSGHAYVYYFLGNINYNKQDYSKAIDYLEKAIDIKNDISSFYFLLSDCYEKSDFNRAVEILNNALDHCDDINNLQLKFAHLYYFKNDFDKVISIVQDLLAKDILEEKTLADSHILLAHTYFSIKDYDDSLENIFLAENHVQEKSYIYYFAGLCYLNKGNDYADKAYEYLKKAEVEGFEIPEQVSAIMRNLEKNRQID